MINFYFKLFSLSLLVIFANCSNNKNSTSADKSEMDGSFMKSGSDAYKKNQEGVITTALSDENSDPLDFVRAEVEDNEIIYLDKSSPVFETQECLYLYIKKEVNDFKLFLKVRYVGEEWIDLENIIFTVDKTDFTFNGESIKTKTKGKKEYKIELFEIPVESAKELSIFEAISNSENTVVLLVGKDSYKKRIVSKNQQIAMINVLNAHKKFQEQQ